MPNKLDPLQAYAEVVTDDKRPTSYLMQQWEFLRLGVTQAVSATINAAALLTRQIIAGTGLTGGGDLSADRTISLANTTVTPGTYGDATTIPVITVDQQGRLTGVSTAAVSGGGGGGGAFIGATGSLGNAGSDPFATKGIFFTPSVNMSVSEIHGYISAPVLNETYVGSIATVSGTAAGFSITSVPSTTNVSTVTSALVGGLPRKITMTFASPVALTAGTTYLIAVSLTSGVGTTPCRLNELANTVTQSSWDINAPGETLPGQSQFNTTSLSNGQVCPSFFATFKVRITIRAS